MKILYEDNHILVVVKPAGLLVQATEQGVDNLLDQLKQFIKKRDQKPGDVFLGLVHRLDRAVSGIIVFAKTSKAASRLSEQFRERDVTKRYTAVVEGRVASDSGTLVHYLKKDEVKKHALISDSEKEDYQRSELSFSVIGRGGKGTLVLINLLTGRFNQIRAQFAHIGHPIVGDFKYGAQTRLSGGAIALCATEVSFRKIVGDETVTLKVNYPSQWRELVL